MATYGYSMPFLAVHPPPGYLAPSSTKDTFLAIRFPSRSASSWPLNLLPLLLIAALVIWRRPWTPDIALLAALCPPSSSVSLYPLAALLASQRLSSHSVPSWLLGALLTGALLVTRQPSCHSEPLCVVM